MGRTRAMSSAKSDMANQAIIENPQTPKSVCSMPWLGRVLVACEFSGRVRDAFQAAGWDAWSADLLPSEGPGNHYQGDVRETLFLYLLIELKSLSDLKTVKGFAPDP